MTKSGKVVCYRRVSSDGQSETGFGLDIQRERIEAYAKAMGLVLDDDFVDDGYSGTTLDRPALKRLIAAMRAGEIAKVIVYKIDRLSRSQRRLLEVIEDEFVKNEVAFVSVCETFDTSTPFGRACLGMLGVFAQLDRDQVVDRLASGRMAKANAGERACGAVPYGYRTIVGDDKRRTTIIDDVEASIIRRIFDSRASKSLQAIADELNAERVPTPGRSSVWRAGTIHSIIHNPIYRGVVSYDVDGRTVEATNESLMIVS